MDAHGPLPPHGLQLLQQRGDFILPHAANHFAFRGAPPFPHFHHPPFPILPNALYPPRSPILPLMHPGAGTRAHFVGSFIHQPPYHPHNPRSREIRRQRPSKRARQRMKKRMYVEENRGESNRQASESGYETTGDCQTPKKIVMPHSNTVKADNSMQPLWSKAVKSKPLDSTSETLESVDEKSHSRSDSASSYNSLNVSDTSLKKLLKDLHRCSVSITRYQAMLTKHCDDGMEKLLHLFSSLKTNLNNREADLIQELNTIKESASAILQRRKDTAMYLRQAAEQYHTLEDVQVTELKQQIKQFVTDRKVDEEIGTIARFQADKDDLLPQIMGFGKVNNVRHLYTEWEENPAEMIEISKHRSFFPSVGKCSSSLSSNSQESIASCNEETTPGLDSAFIESSNTSLEPEEPVSGGDLDSSVNSNNTKAGSENGLAESQCVSSSSVETETQTEQNKADSSCSKDQEIETPTSPTHVTTSSMTTSSSVSTSCSSSSNSAAVKHETSKTEHHALPRTPQKSPKTLKTSVVVIVNSNKSPPTNKEGKKNQWNLSSAKKGRESDKKRTTAIVVEDIIVKNSDSGICHKDAATLAQEMKDDSKKYSAAELRQIQQRVRDSLRQQGVYLYDPVTGDGPPKSPPNTYQTRPEGTKDSNEAPLIRKKKTPTQLRRERKKRQKERERRQRELEKKAQTENAALSKHTASETKTTDVKQYKVPNQESPESPEQKAERQTKSVTALKLNTKQETASEREDQQLDSTESCLVSSDSDPNLLSNTDSHLSNSPKTQLQTQEELQFDTSVSETSSVDSQPVIVTDNYKVQYNRNDTLPTQPDASAEPEIDTQPDTNAEPKIDIQPDTNAQPEIVTQPDADAEPKIDSQPDRDVNAEPEIVTQPDTNAEPETVTQPDTNAEAEIDSQPDRDVNAEPEIVTQPDADAEPETVTQPDTNAEPKIDSQPDRDVNAEPEIVTQPDTNAEPETVTQPDTNAEAEIDSQPDRDVNAEPEIVTQPDADAEPETVTQPDTNAEPQIDIQPNADAELEIVTQPDANVEPEIDSQPDRDTNAEPKIDSQPDTNAEPKIDSQPDTNAEPEIDSQPDRDASAEPKIVTQPDTDAEPEIDSQPDRDASAEPEIDTQPDTNEEPQIDTQPDTNAEPQIVTQPDTDAEPEIDSQPDRDASAEPETVTQPDADAEPEIDSQPDHDTDAEAEIDSQPDHGADAEPEIVTQPDTNAEPEIDHDTQSDTNTELKTVTHPETNSEPEIDSDTQSDTAKNVPQLETSVEPEIDAKLETNAEPELDTQSDIDTQRPQTEQTLPKTDLQPKTTPEGEPETALDPQRLEDSVSNDSSLPAAQEAITQPKEEEEEEEEEEEQSADKVETETEEKTNSEAERQCNTEPGVSKDEINTVTSTDHESPATEKSEEALTIQEESTIETESAETEDKQLPNEDETSQEDTSSENTGQEAPNDATPTTTPPLATPSNTYSTSDDTTAHFTNNDNITHGTQDGDHGDQITNMDKGLPKCTNGIDYVTITTNTVETNSVVMETGDKELSLESRSQNKCDAVLRHEE